MDGTEAGRAARSAPDPAARPEPYAVRRCRRAGLDFADLFRLQYVLSRDPAPRFPGYAIRELGGWALHHGAGLPVAEVRDADGAPAGWVLGWALTEASRPVAASLDLPARSDGPGFFAAAEPVVTGMTGRYLVILFGEGQARLYADPVSDLSWLYHTGTGEVGASLGLLIDGPPLADPDFAIGDLVRGRQMTAFGHTADIRARRGMSNHWLDLDTQALTRHWPATDAAFETPPEDVDATLQRMAWRLSAHMAGWIRSHDCMLSLTGGHDSRMLLAASMENLDGLAEISGYRFHNPTRRDASSGKALAAMLGREYRQYFRKETPVSAKAAFRLKTGWFGMRAEIAAIAMIEEYPRDHLVFRGGVGELMRANQWRPDRITPGRVNLTHALRRLRVAGTGTLAAAKEKWGPAYTAWFDALPEGAKARPYDFAHVEHWLPHTLGAYYNGFHRTPFIDPFNDRALIAGAIGMPVMLRKEIEVIRRFIRILEPRLLDIPFH